MIALKIIICILILDAFALWLISKRLDAERWYTLMDNIIFHNAITCVINVIVIAAILPFTIIVNIKELFKN